MPYRKAIGVLAVLLLALGAATGVSAAAKKPPKRATIRAVQKLKMKPNRYILDGLRWNRDVYRVRSGGTLHIVNDAPDEGPHTFTVVKKKDLPKNVKQALNCKICNTLAAAHGADLNTGAPPKFQYLENGVGQNTPPDVDRPGDSGITGQGKKGESITLHVTAPAGKTLYFMCIIHDWMQAKVIVGKK
jgi:hypothetical protein